MTEQQEKPQRTRVSAYGLLKDKTNNKMLLCRLSNMIYDKNYIGYWTLPGGGIDFGETPQDAAVREIKEETGLDVEIGEVVAVDSIYDSDEAFQGIRIIYNATVIGGNLQNEVNGSTDTCAWLSLKEIAELPIVELAKIGIKLC